VPCLCEFYPGICLTTEEKARKNLSQGKKNLRLRKTSEYSIYITKTSTHYKTLTNTHIIKPTHTHTHTITKQYKTTTVQIETKCISRRQSYTYNITQLNDTVLKLGAFYVRSINREKHPLASSPRSLCQHAPARIPLDRLP
jgi:hypothetical protein